MMLEASTGLTGDNAMVKVKGNNTTGAVFVEAMESTVILDLTLSLDTSAYLPGDVLAATQELADVARVAGGTARLDSLVVIDKDAQGAAFDLFFFSTNVSIGTENTAAALADADSVQCLGIVPVAAVDYVSAGVGVKIATVPIPANINLKAASGSTSVYVAAITRGTPTHSAAGLVLRIGAARV